MRSSLRVLLVGIPLVVFLALPAIGIADSPKDPVLEPGSGAQVTLSGGTNVAMPAAIPGAKMGTLGDSDTFPYYNAAGATVITAYVNPIHYQYNSVANWPILAPLGLPVGATLLQIDVYGYATGATNQAWELVDQDTSTGADTATYSLPATPNGPGLVQSTRTFPSGLTLTAGHSWAMDLSDTDSTNGLVGVIFQYTQPTLSFVPITPVRVFDSRFSSKIVQGAPRTINVKDAINVNTGAVTTPNAIPVGARAISFTLTVTTTGNPGFVSVLPGTTTTVTASTINWTASGATIAAGGVVSLGAGTAERQVTLVVGGAGSASTDVILDITGYYM